MATKAHQDSLTHSIPKADLHSERSDEELVECYRESRDPRVFELIVRRYERELYSFLRRFLGDVQKAEDAFQATFITVHSRLEQFEAGRRFRPWLYAVATNKAIDFRRHAKRRAALSLDASWPDHLDSKPGNLASQIASRESDPAETAIENERRQDVRDMVAKLSEPTQLLIHMAFFEGMRYADIGEALGIPVGTVKSRVFNAIRKLGDHWRRMAQE